MSATAPPLAWYRLKMAEVWRVLQAEPLGLTDAEAARRLQKYGRNVITVRERFKIWRQMLAATNDLMVWLMVGAGVISLLLGDLQTAIIFGVVILVSLIINFFQSYTADRVTQSLGAFLQAQTAVRRTGVVREIPTAELVPGDILILEEGDAIPADVRLITAQNLQINSFSVTGESQPQSKDAAEIAEVRSFAEQTNLLFAGSLVATGSAEGVVIATGLDTIFGGIARLSAGITADRTPLQKELDRLAKRNTWFALGMLALMFLLSQTVLHYGWTAGLFFAVAVATALVPEGLPLEVNVSLLLSALRMGRQKAIVKKLSAVEALGSADVICTDKTGTLTRNEMSAVAAFGCNFSLEIMGEGYAPSGTVLQNGAPLPAALQTNLQPFFASLFRNNRAHVAPPDSYHASYYVLGDPTEGALIVLGQRFGVSVAPTAPLAEVPFDSARKMMSTLFSAENGWVKSYTKGAPETVLPHVTHILDAKTGAIRKWIAADTVHFQTQLATYAGQAYRLLAIAERHFPQPVTFDAKTVETDLTLLGFVALFDPPRAGVAEAFALARAAHIKTVVITGDNLQTATAIAQQVGMLAAGRGAAYLVEGKTLETLDDVALVKKIEASTAAIFARVSPAQKLRIVNALKKAGHVVAVTGDGVNDAPAIKRADIGVAMGVIGTATAKEAADLILVDDSYATLVHAIREGRTIYQNLIKTVKACYTSNIAELMLVISGLFTAVAYFDGVMPLTAAQILLIDLFGETIPLIALTFDGLVAGSMQRPPRDQTRQVLAGRTLADIGVTGLLMGVTDFAVFAFTYGVTQSAPISTTATYLTLILTQYLNILSRRDAAFTWSRSLFTNRWLWVAFAGTLTIIFALLYLPILQNNFHGFAPVSLAVWGYIGVALLIYAPLLEWKKWLFRT